MAAAGGHRATAMPETMFLVSWSACAGSAGGATSTRDPDGGMDILNQAVKRLYGIGDHQPLAMAERLQAVKLRGHKGRVEGWEALLSALRHAQAAAHQTAAGTAALTAAKWRTADALG